MKPHLELCMHINCVDRRERKRLTHMHGRWVILLTCTSAYQLVRHATLASTPLPFTSTLLDSCFFRATRCRTQRYALRLRSHS